MRKHLLLAVLVSGSALLAEAAVQADTLALPQGDGTPAPTMLPTRGSSMNEVLHRFGQPLTRHGAVGGETARHPPITRWDYSGFSVFFEHSHVINAVVPDHPPEVYHADKLQAVN